MTTPLTYADAEGAVRAWGRTLGLVGSRVFFEPPERGRVYPLITVQRVGGAPLNQDVPIDGPLIQFDVLGEKRTDKAAVGAIAYQLASAVMSLRSGTAMGTAAVALSGTVTSGPLWMPEPETGRARYSLDARFKLRAA